jgi:hypothetical protein
MLHTLVIYVTTDSCFIITIVDSGVLVLTHGETISPLIRPLHTMDILEFWGRLHSPLKKTGGGRFINELNYSWRTFRTERDLSITLMVLF